MAKYQIAQNMGWANVDISAMLAPVAAEIAHQMRPGKPAGFYDGVRFSVNKRGGSTVLGIATAELDRIDTEKAKAVKASADKAAPDAGASVAALQAQVAALMAALQGQGVVPAAVPASEAPKAAGRRGRKAA